jgi:hypothetical protein
VEVGASFAVHAEPLLALVYGLIPEANTGATVHALLPGGAAAAYGRRGGK